MAKDKAGTSGRVRVSANNHAERTTNAGFANSDGWNE